MTNTVQRYYSLAVRPNDLNYHLEALTRILEEEGAVQIFPLCDGKSRPNPLLGPLMKALQERDLGIEITQDSVLNVWVQECILE